MIHYSADKIKNFESHVANQIGSVNKKKDSVDEDSSLERDENELPDKALKLQMALHN